MGASVLSNESADAEHSRLENVKSLSLPRSPLSSFPPLSPSSLPSSFSFSVVSLSSPLPSPSDFHHVMLQQEGSSQAG